MQPATQKETRATPRGYSGLEEAVIVDASESVPLLAS
jgi:hypothetical protein